MERSSEESRRKLEFLLPLKNASSSSIPPLSQAPPPRVGWADGSDVDKWPGAPLGLLLDQLSGVSSGSERPPQDIPALPRGAVGEALTWPAP